MKVKFKFVRNINPNTYFAFTLIDIDFINTFQVVAFNITVCNLLLQVIHEK